MSARCQPTRVWQASGGRLTLSRVHKAIHDDRYHPVVVVAVRDSPTDVYEERVASKSKSRAGRLGNRGGLTAGNDKYGVGDHEKQAHLGLEDALVAASHEGGEEVGDVASDEGPARASSVSGRGKVVGCGTHIRMDAMRGEIETRPVWRLVKPYDLLKMRELVAETSTSNKLAIPSVS